MRPGYLSGYGEDRTRPGNFGYNVIAPDSPEEAMDFLAPQRFPREIEVSYLPEYIKLRKKWYGPGAAVDPRRSYFPGRPFVRPRHPSTFNVLTV
jgi:hypothetical protein